MLRRSGYNFGTLPNLPHFRPGPADIPCDSLISETTTASPAAPKDIRVWPVPAADVLYFSADAPREEPLYLVQYLITA